MPRSATELTSVEDPAWPLIRRAIEQAPQPVRVLPLDRPDGERVIERLQVTARSVLGALALECGGLLLDHGWLRILGGGSPGIPDLATANGLEAAEDTTGAPDFMLVAWDVVGGRFAIDGGGLGVGPGQVCYFGPDSLRWEGLELGHGDFVSAMIGGATTRFYEGLRWPGWEQECAGLALDYGVWLYPPPFSVEGKDMAAVSRRAVPMSELLAFYEAAAGQMGA